MRNSETRIALNTDPAREADKAIGLVRRLIGWGAGIAATAALALAPIQAQAQEVETFDPDVAFEAYQANGDTAQAESGIDADLVNPALRSSNPDAALPSLPEQPRGPVRVQPQSGPATVITQGGFDDEFSDYSDSGADSQAGEAVPMWSDPEPGEQVASAADSTNALPADANSGTYGEDDLIGAAEGVFGKGAEGLAGMIEDLLRKQGEPNGYIVGREGGGAFIFGVRYGSGTLHHKVEGERKVYWTGPSLGFDAGANAGNTFVLVYNLYDSEDLFKRYPAGEGQAYLVGGLHASYMRRGDVVLIPIRVGAGLRLGVNAGYMRFSKKQRWLPF